MTHPRHEAPRPLHMGPARRVARIRAAVFDLLPGAFVGEVRIVFGQFNIGPVGDEGQRAVALAEIERQRGHQVEARSFHSLLVGEKTHRGKTGRVGDACGQQRLNIGRCQLQAAGEGDPVGNLDVVVIEGHIQGAGRKHQAQRGVYRLFGRQRRGAFLLRDGICRRQRSDIRQEAHEELGGDIAQVRLSRRRHTEAGADRAADRHIVGYLQPRRQFAVKRVAEVRVVLETQGSAKKQRFVHIGFDVEIGAPCAHGVIACVSGLETREAVGTDAESLGGEIRVDEKRIRLAVADGEGLVAVLDSRRHVHAVHVARKELPRQVKVHDPISLDITAGIVIDGNVVAPRKQLRIDRVVNVEIGRALSGHGADVVEPSRIELAAYAAGETDVVDITAELRRETAGEFLDQ